jgi:hypothetical protein
LGEICLFLAVEEADATRADLGAAMLAWLALLNVDYLAGLVVYEGIASYFEVARPRVLVGHSYTYWFSFKDPNSIKDCAEKPYDGHIVSGSYL